MTANAGFAVICDERGRVTERLYNELALPLQTGRALAEVVDSADREKLERLLATVTGRLAAFDWPINVPVDGGIETLRFGGARIGDRIFVMGARTRLGLVALSEQLPIESTDSHPRLRQVLRESARELEERSAMDERVFDELSALTNELATAQRRLARSNRDLAHANEELRALYEALPIGIFRLNRGGRLEQANSRFFKILGGIAPHQWFAGVRRDDRAEAIRGLRQAIEKGASWRATYRQRGRQGQTRHIRVELVPIRTEGTAGAGFVGLVEDVTDSVALEEKNREVARQQSIAELTGGLAHHLNSLLTVIIGTQEQMRDHLTEAHPAMSNLQLGVTASNRAAKLVERLMIYSGIKPMPPGYAPIDQVLGETIEAWRAELPSTVGVHVELTCPNVRLETADTLLAEVLRELLANALGALPGSIGQIRVQSALESSVTGADGIRIAVSDSGVGMDPAVVRRIADPFFTTRNAAEAMGLGLTLADGFARHAGGSMIVHSAPGEGTTVELRIPLAGDSAIA